MERDLTVMGIWYQHMTLTRSPGDHLTTKYVTRYNTYWLIEDNERIFLM